MSYLRKLKSLYVWHRYVGLTAATLVILLVLTGIPLNHTEQYALNSRYIQQPWLLDWYGIEAPDHYRAYSTPVGTVTLLETQIYLDVQRIEGEYQQLNGAVAVGGMIVVAVDNRLLLLTHAGERIESLTSVDGIPDGLERIGIGSDGRLGAATDQSLYLADADILRWQAVDIGHAAIDWSQPAQLSKALDARLKQAYRERILPVERVLLDLHSGRFFGAYGPWVLDAAALLMLFLACSGILIWLKRKR